MKRSKEEAKRWFIQAKKDLEVSKKLDKEREYAYSCFLCEQAAQKALKAYLYFRNERYIWEHSIQVLLKKCSDYDNEISEMFEAGKVLDKYYLVARYPDAVAPPAVPFELFTEEESKKAIELAEKIINLVKNKFES